MSEPTPDEMQAGFAALASFMPQAMNTVAGTTAPSQVQDVLSGSGSARAQIRQQLETLKALAETALTNLESMSDEQVAISAKAIGGLQGNQQQQNGTERRDRSEFRNQVKAQTLELTQRRQQARATQEQMMLAMMNMAMKKLTGEEMPCPTTTKSNTGHADAKAKTPPVGV